MRVFTLVGKTLDRASTRRGKFEKRFERRWRPSVSLAAIDGITDLHLIYGESDRELAEQIADDVLVLNPSLSVHVDHVEFENPWDLASTYLTLDEYIRQRSDEMDGPEDWLFHITTGTHVQQICIFLLVESRHFVGRLVQSSPPDKDHPYGGHQVIDLDLSQYAPIAERFALDRQVAVNTLKSGIATRNTQFNDMIEELEVVAARSTHPILLMGPTGAGKSALARRIHGVKHHFGLLQGPIVEVNCATLRGDNAMSALFGHKRGAFTGATSDREGLLRKADGGLLFLDEIGELGEEEQAMLLSAIEQKTFYPMGSDKPVTSDFQIVAGTNCDLRGESQGGNFREDLLARLNLWEFHLPSLRERPEDIEPNIDYELGRLSAELGMRIRFGGPARRQYLDFALSDQGLWLGNFRDLIASLTRMSTLAAGGEITVDVVEREIDRLHRIWNGNGVGNRQVEKIKNARAMVQLEHFLGSERCAQLDEIDRTILAKVLEVCMTSESVAEASRRLMGKSRERMEKPNDTNRLKAYVARWKVDPAEMVRFGKEI